MSLDPAASDAVSTRRGMLVGVGLVGLAGTLTACGGDGGDGGSMTSGEKDEGSSTSDKKSGTALAKTSEIPVGGGKIFKKHKVVVTQPKQGEFKAFSAVCTHRGCTVDKISGGTIDCPCHGSRYSVADASVVAGPAPKPLPHKDIQVSGGEIRLV